MDKCFVIQPFDKGKYDKRFTDTFAPAIKNAELEPYRVDLDREVEIPIEDIEKGIRNSRLCLADISEDNPNVWYELGYAIAAGKSIIMVCAHERDKFPFDIQHRSIIRYKTESGSDFTKLKDEITEKIVALLTKEVTIDRISGIKKVTNTKGLAQHEVVALATVMENQLSPSEGGTSYDILGDMLKAGYKKLAVTLGLRSLLEKDLLEVKTNQDMNGNEFSIYIVTKSGYEWLQENLNEFTLKDDNTRKVVIKPPDVGDEEIPF